MQNKAWALVKAQASSVMMSMFMFWMIGGNLSIFTIIFTVMFLFTPINSLLRVNAGIRFINSRIRTNGATELELTHSKIGIRGYSLGTALSSSLQIREYWLDSSAPLRLDQTSTNSQSKAVLTQAVENVIILSDWSIHLFCLKTYTPNLVSKSKKLLRLVSS